MGSAGFGRVLRLIGFWRTDGSLINEFRIGDILLRTRFVMAPMTRARAPDDVLF